MDAELLDAALLVPEFPLPELPAPGLAVTPEAEVPPAEPVDANPPVVDDDAVDAAPSGAARPANAAPEGPPEPLLPLAARPDADAEPEPVGAANVAPVPVEPPVEPPVTWVVCDTGPEEPDVPPGPLDAVLFDDGLELADPLTPPEAVAPVNEGPLPPDEALPLELPVDPPLDPPVELLVDGPLLPLPAVDDAAAGVAGAGGTVEGPLFNAAASTTLEIRPITGGHRRRSGQMRQPWIGTKHRSATRPGGAAGGAA
ncbi:MAG TPA: hypothetical protein VHT75_06230 [Acidimicrobiales bacterium]|nr:hypothetical protein [Acidimicrobiales bacterium]